VTDDLIAGLHADAAPRAVMRSARLMIAAVASSAGAVAAAVAHLPAVPVVALITAAPVLTIVSWLTLTIAGWRMPPSARVRRTPQEARA
jgi:hypothetical protein